jgi:hypothetical protein
MDIVRIILGTILCAAVVAYPVFAVWIYHSVPVLQVDVGGFALCVSTILMILLSSSGICMLFRKWM